MFISIAMILGDGLYNFGKVFSFMFYAIYKSQTGKKSDLPVSDGDDHAMTIVKPVSFDDEKRTRLFLKDQISYYIAIPGYIIVAIISMFTLPYIFKPLKW